MNNDFDDSVRADIEHMRDHKRYSRSLAGFLACCALAILFAAAGVVFA